MQDLDGRLASDLSLAVISLPRRLHFRPADPHVWLSQLSAIVGESA